MKNTIKNNGIRNLAIFISSVSFFISFFVFNTQYALAFYEQTTADEAGLNWFGVTQNLTDELAGQTISSIKLKFSTTTDLCSGTTQSIPQNIYFWNETYDGTWDTTNRTTFGLSAQNGAFYTYTASTSVNVINESYFRLATDWPTACVIMYGSTNEDSFPNGAFYENEVGGWTSNIADLYFQFISDPPIIGIMQPQNNVTYGNPVKFQGAITNAVNWQIYTGNELNTTDTLQLEGYSANGLPDDFILDHAFYLPVGTQYFNIVANGLGGSQDTTSYKFFVDNSVSLWGTSTYPVMLPNSTSTATTTINSLYNAISACDLSDITGCAMSIANWAGTEIKNYANNFIKRAPWGYATRLYAIFNETSTTTLPSLAFTIPSGKGLPTTAVGKSFEFNPLDETTINNAYDMINNNGTTTSHGNSMETFTYYWNFAWYILIGLYLGRRIYYGLKGAINS